MVFCVGSFVFKSGFFCNSPQSISRLVTALPKTPARLARFPLKPTPMQEGWGRGFFVKGDRPNTHSRAEKKDYENYITKNWFRAREPIRTVEQQQHTGAAGEARHSFAD